MTHQPLRTVMVTGCSTGIGEATAHVLHDAGWRVFPTARKEDDLKALREQGFDAVKLDIGDSQSVKDAAEQVLSLGEGRLDALVNNAGIAQPGALEDVTRDALRHQFEVNVFGTHQLTNAILPAMLKQQSGRIVHISSVLGRVTTPFVGSYCASKYALEALADASRIELKDTGIKVVLIEPGPIVSAFRRNAAQMADDHLDPSHSRFGESYEKEITRRKKQRKKPDFFTRPPEAVAEKVLKALESRYPKTRYCVTIPAYAGAFVRRFVPTRLLDHLLAGRI